MRVRWRGTVAGLLFGAFPLGLVGQVGSVYDRLSGGAVAAATVSWRAEQDGRVLGAIAVDAGGRFAVPNAWTSRGWVEVRALGHHPLSMSVAAAEAARWRLGLEPDPLGLDAVVVTASGRTQRRSEVAVPVARISAREIEASGAVSAASLLSEVPGLQSTGAPPVGSNIMIRGIGESRVLVLLDGQPAGGALLENRDLSRLSLAGVERVEVVKGPLSSLYGSDALGGVINVISREPDPGFRVDAAVRSGDAGRREADASVSGGGSVRYRATGGWRQEDRVPGLDRSLDTFARVWDLRSSVRYGDDGPWHLRGDLSFLRERQRWPVGGGFSGFNDNRGITGWAEARRDVGAGAWSLRVFGQDYRHLYRSARGDAPIAGADEERQLEQVWKGTLAYARPWGAHHLDGGVEASHRTIESPDKILEDRASDDQLELFAQDAWRLGSTSLSGGFRVTLNDRWGSTVSPNLGVTRLFGDRLSVRATVGRGFRAPSFKELAWDFANVGAGYTVQGFADLEPEHSWSVSGGVDWAPSPRFGLGLEGYVNAISNMIETAFVGSTPAGLLIYSPRNVSEARTQGFEASARGRFDHVEVDAEYAFLDARALDQDLPLDRRARHSGRVRAGSELPLLSGLRLDLTGHVTGEAPLIGLDGSGRAAQIGVQERFVSLDGQVGLAVPGGFRLTVGVDNVFDTRPGGWQAVVGRRLRVGLQAVDLF
jgi:outer membrane receptor for ferrienterochelin and colicins